MGGAVFFGLLSQEPHMAVRGRLKVFSKSHHRSPPVDGVWLP